jgi:Protein of unknown function (DUF454)
MCTGQKGSDMPPTVIKLIWRSIALTSLLLGLVGLVLPLLPTVPFVLVAAHQDKVLSGGT